MLVASISRRYIPDRRDHPPFSELGRLERNCSGSNIDKLRPPFSYCDDLSLAEGVSR